MSQSPRFSSRTGLEHLLVGNVSWVKESRKVGGGAMGGSRGGLGDGMCVTRKPESGLGEGRSERADSGRGRETRVGESRGVW